MPTIHYRRIRFATSIDGKKIQIYCKSKETYDQLTAEVAKRTGTNIDAGIVRNKVKSIHSKSPDLPVGISEMKGERCRAKDGGPRRMKTRKGNPLGSFNTWFGKNAEKRSRTVTYGDKRSREEALEIIIKARLDYIASLNEKETELLNFKNL